jgi:UDP-glucose 4-epimerase
MKVLVTGGAGFIGSHVTDQLIRAGHSVCVVDDLSTGRSSNLNPAARFYQVDIRSPEMRDVLAAEHPEVITHHAAQMDVRRSMVDPLFDADVNILGSIRLANLAHEFGVRKFIHISSGGAAYGEPVRLPCKEDDPAQPLSFYGASKYTFELYLYIYKQSFGLDFTVLRYPNVYGPRQDPHGEAGVVAIFAGRMLTGQSVTINGNGEQVRDFVYVEDCARANLLVLSEGGGRVYNLGNGAGTSVNEIFGELKNITGYAQEPAYGLAKAGETFRIFLDANRAKEELGWKPTVDLKTGLSRTVDYFQEAELKT